MQYRLDLKEPSSSDWLKVVMDDFDAFLKDHADCERKASSMAMSFVAKYPDRVEIIPELINTAIEELEHFQQVSEILLQRKIGLPHQIKPDPYVKDLVAMAHSGREERFLDRLLIASIVETRGAERFKMIAEALKDEALKKFYKELWTSEAKHGEVFVRMALNYFPENRVYHRLEWWANIENDVLQNLELRPALH
jgi:tRNA-(ms[2]io[6]A)-hydroxylase